MLEEQQIISYQTSEIPPGPWLVFAPHPDDETFGMGGTIALAVQAGIAVYVVVITDGSQGSDPKRREQEIFAATKVLGLQDVFFWRFVDRALSQAHISVEKLASLLNNIKPKTIFLPHPQEFHPDLRSATIHLHECFNTVFFPGQVWLYEISRQCEINRLIDISSVVETKIQAIQCYPSQLIQQDYKDIVLSLNRARSYALGKNISYAEGFWVVSNLRNLFQELREHIQAYFTETDNCTPFISIIVRTMNRADLLAEALKSIADQSLKDIEAVIVCDGGEDVSFVLDRFRGSIKKITYVRHDYSKGRAGAANSGIKHASGTWISFLDDDDLLEPDAMQNHLLKVTETGAKIVYGKVIREHYTQDGVKNTDLTDYLYDRTFDRQLLFLQNYIPFISLFLHKDIFSKCGMFDETLAINEDWDFLIRAAQDNEFIFHDSLVARYRCFGSSTVIDGRLGKDVIADTEYRVRRRWWKKLSPKVIDSFRQYVAKETEKHFTNEINKLNQQIWSLEQEKESLSKRIQELEQNKQHIEYQDLQLKLMRDSFSWKLTSPLRYLRSWQKRITAKITTNLQKKNLK